MAFAAMWTLMFGPLPGGPGKASTGYTSSPPTALSSERFIFLKRAPIFASVASRETLVHDFEPVSLRPLCRDRRRPDGLMRRFTRFTGHLYLPFRAYDR